MKRVGSTLSAEISNREWSSFAKKVRLRGRPVDDPRVGKVERLIGEGVPISAACQRVGIPRSTFYARRRARATYGGAPEAAWWRGDRKLVANALADARQAGVPEEDIQEMLPIAREQVAAMLAWRRRLAGDG
jgi:hypothetical protein